MSGIKLNIPDSAKDNSIQIFEMLWSREITDLLVSSTSNYGIKLTSQIQPHKKHCSKIEKSKKKTINTRRSTTLSRKNSLPPQYKRKTTLKLQNMYKKTHEETNTVPI